MLLKVDAKALEWRVAVELSGDKVGMQEILNGVDMHRENQKTYKLPGWDIDDPKDDQYKLGRLTAKLFIFRLIFGGGAYSYANDNNFSHISSSKKYWQKVIDKTYEKYKGLAQWHKNLMQQVIRNGYVRTPFGREYHYKPEKKLGEMVWPRTTILNYSVQGAAADLMQIARISAWRRLRDKALFVSTVHDDLELDVVNNAESCYNICIELENVFKDVNENVKKLYGYDMKVPLAGEVAFGHNLLDMTEFDRSKGIEQFQL